MPDNAPHAEAPSLSTSLEIERVRRRLAAVEARVKELDSPRHASAGVLASRFLAGMSGVVAAALVVIAASLVWQAAYPAASARPVAMRAPAGDASAQAQPFRQPGLSQSPGFRPGPRG